MAHRFNQFSYQKLYEANRYNPAVYKKMIEDKIDVNAYISIKKKSDISKLRQKLFRVIFDYDKLTKETPDKVVNIKRSNAPIQYEHTVLVQQYYLRMERGLKVTGYIYHPKNPNGKLLLYLYGHGGETFLDETAAAKYFVENNYTVATIDMPMENLNSEKRIIDHEKFGKITLRDHYDLPFLNPEVGHYFQYFVLPGLSVLNYLLPRYEFDNVIVTGRSGGGWTSLFLSALDERIDQTYPVADNSPLYFMNYNIGEVGCNEETDPHIFSVANYLDLYILASCREKGSRVYVQTLNEFDECCNPGANLAYRTYRDVLKKKIEEEFKCGTYDVKVDMGEKKHIYSKKTIKFVDKLIKQFDPKLSGSLLK